MIRIAVAEDNSFLAKAIINKLGLFDDCKVKFHANDGKEFIAQLASDSNIHIALLDIQMPEMDGIQTCQEITDRYPHIKSIMLTVKDDEQSIYKAIMAGASGYLLKESDPDQLKNAIDTVMEGKSMLDPSVATKAMRIIQNPEMVQEEQMDFELSDRELDVLKQLCKGLNATQIGVNLNISPNTVRRHTENIYRKLEVNNKSQAIQKAFRHKLV